MRMRGFCVWVSAFLLISARCLGVGSISGYVTDPENTGTYESEVFAAKTGTSSNTAYYRCLTSGYYELTNLSAGTYSIGINDGFHFHPRHRSFVPVRDGQVTPGNLKLRSTYWVRNRASDDSPLVTEMRQTFVATGHVVKITVVSLSHEALTVSIHNASTGAQVGPTRQTNIDDRDTVKYLHGEVPCVAGQLYYVRLLRAGGGLFSLRVDAHDSGNAYPQGQAYYDGVAQPNVDVGMVIESDDDGFSTMYFKPTNTDGEWGTELGQTFVAIGSDITLVTLFATAAGGDYVDVAFSILSGGPGGTQTGPTKIVRIRNYQPMGQLAVITWQPGEVPVTSGQTYYLKMASSGFYVFTNRNNRYASGACYVNGSILYANEDICATIEGEAGAVYSALGTIMGTVRDVNGNGVSGATVTATPWGYSATTGTDGSYTLYRISADTYTVTATASGYSCAPSYSNVVVAPGQVVTQNFEMLTSGARIAGYVRDTQGNPLGGAILYCSPANKYATSRSGDGFYQFTGLTTSTQNISCQKSGYASQNTSVGVTECYTSWLDFALQPQDTTPPTTPVVTDDGVYTTSTSQLHATWTSSDPESGIAEYQYAIGTSQGATDVVNWTSTGTTASVTKTGLTLSYNQTYYFSVRARNGIGLWSSSGYSDGITVARPVGSIVAAKGYPDGSAVQISGKPASAKIGTAFWIEEADRSSGIKVNSAMSVTAGTLITVVGRMASSQGERFLDQPAPSVGSGVTAPPPVALGSRALGGAALNAYTPGVAGGLGPNNIGLLVKTWGRVTQTGADYFYINDGANLMDGTTTGGAPNVGVRVLSAPGALLPGDFVIVTGISSSFGVSGQIRPVVLPIVGGVQKL